MLDDQLSMTKEGLYLQWKMQPLYVDFRFHVVMLTWDFMLALTAEGA